ncbi:c-type cytochrome [Halomonas denitrificans]|nr:c-type cytochrome [Halomonas denitrificans]
MKTTAIVIKTLAVSAILATLGALAFAWSGLYPVAAGSGHTGPVAWWLETVRERSVAVRSADLIVPDDLDSPERIAAGAGHYKSMCASCHGAPGGQPADAWDPAPPAIFRERVDPAEAFWTIKHGLKMTAMPSHLDHSDAENWDTVAFVLALPDMDAAEYSALTANASHDHGDGGGHDHGGGGGHDHGSGAHHGHDMPRESPDMHPASGGNGSHSSGHHHAMDASSPETVLDGFQHALTEGRAEEALAYLHPDATVVEGGHVQSVDDYRGGHLGSDMAFLARVGIERLARSIHSGGGQATVETRSRFTGEIDGETLDLESTEFATLVETEDGWRISQIAWTTRPYGEAQSDEPVHEHAPGDDDHDH